MRTLFISALIFCLSLNLTAQPGFNKSYKQFASDRFCRLIVDNDTIYCIGTAYDPNATPLQILMVKLDTLGNILQTKLHKDSLDGFLSMDFLYGGIIETRRQYFAFDAVVFGRASAQIIQINKELSAQSIFEYSISDNYVERYEQIFEMQDSGFMIVGSAQRPNLKTDGFIRRVDANGNVLWFKYYGEYNKDESMRAIVKVSDNRLVVAGGAGPNDNDPFTLRAGIWVIDSNGIVLNTWLGPNQPDLLVLRGLIGTPDGGFIAHGRTYQGEGDWGSKVQISLMKFDSSFQFQWLKHIGPASSNYNGVYDMIATPDGNYIVAGERTAYGDLSQSSTDWGGWLYKFSPQGDSLWSRADNAPPGMNATGEFVYGGVGVLSSGSIVAGGKGDIDGKFVGWVVKVTPDGCMDTLFCHTSAITEISGAKRFVLAPNPARDMVQLRFGEAAGPGTLVQVWDLAGRLLRTQSIETGTLTQAISVSGFAEGCYVVIIIAQGKVMAREKLVVLR